MLKKILSRLITAALLITTITTTGITQAPNPEPWTEKQLMPAAELATTINNGKSQPLIFCIGPNAIIKGSIDIGSTKDKDNLKNLKEKVSKLTKDAPIVVYCGCCPFEHCPNIRPAFELLNKMNFTNHKLLNLPKNVKVDWIDKGYPVNPR